MIAEDNPVNQKVALNQLKNLGYTADVANNGQVDKFLASGMDDFLSKPVRKEQLLAKLEQWSQNTVAAEDMPEQQETTTSNVEVTHES